MSSLQQALDKSLQTVFDKSVGVAFKLHKKTTYRDDAPTLKSVPVILLEFPFLVTTVATSLAAKATGRTLDVSKKLQAAHYLRENGKF